MHTSKARGFTILELLIVIGILALVGLAVLVILDPFGQLKKARDSGKKADLARIKTALEEYYNDKGCYPQPQQMCYANYISKTSPSNNSSPCYICGKGGHTPSSLPPYLSQLPCDSLHPSKDYVYEVDNVDCPSWYRIYTALEFKADPVIAQLGCIADGCGPWPYGKNYAATSPNTDLQKSLQYHCWSPQGNSCQSCGDVSQCRCNGPTYPTFFDCYKAHLEAYTTTQLCSCKINGVWTQCGTRDECTKIPFCECTTFFPSPKPCRKDYICS